MDPESVYLFRVISVQICGGRVEGVGRLREELLRRIYPAHARKGEVRRIRQHFGVLQLRKRQGRMRESPRYPDEPEDQRKDHYQNPCAVETPSYRMPARRTQYPPTPSREAFRYGRKDQRDGESQKDVAKEGVARIDVIDGPQPVA